MGVWWVHGHERLSDAHTRLLAESEDDGIGVAVISCREVAKLVEVGRLALPCPVGEWLEQALDYPGVSLLPLTPEIAVESTRLPGTFHRDPADQLIVATARVHGLQLLTTDSKILDYPHVDTGKNADPEPTSPPT